MNLIINIKMLKQTTYLMNYYSQQDKKTELRNAFGNNMSTDIKFSKTQIAKTIQFGGFLGSL